MPAAANCNLIPSAVTSLGSTLGRVDRPIASPGQTVTVSRDFACIPTALGFDPIAGNNTVRIVFEPPGSENDPSLVTEVPVAASTVSDCGPARCAALSFVVPDTDDLLDPPGDGRGLVGPARIEVLGPAGALRAEIGELFQPTLSCNDQTPDPIFEQFVVLPPPNVIPSASASGETVEVVMQAAVDAGGDLIVPIDYTGVLPTGSGGPLARILDATWDLPAFENDPNTPIAFPDNGFEWIRAFSDVGRAIPPFLEIEGAGGALSGSVDAAVSVLHLQNDDGQGPIFDLTFRLVDGRGPVIINDPVSITIGGAIPLESLTTAADTAVFVVDEAAQGEDLDGDGLLESQVVQIKNVDTGDSISTGHAVTEVSFDSVNKQALANAGGLIAYLQSESASRVDLPPPGSEGGDGDRLDDALRVFDSFGDAIAPNVLGATKADALPVVNNRSLAVTDGDLVVFGSFEGDDSFVDTELVSVSTEGESGLDTSRDPDLSEDGLQVAFVSGSRNFLPQSAYILEIADVSGSTTIDFQGLTGGTQPSFDPSPGFEDFPVDLSGFGQFGGSIGFTGDLASAGNTGTWTFSIGDVETGGEDFLISSDGTSPTYTICEPGTYPETCPPYNPATLGIQVGSTVVLEAIVPSSNLRASGVSLPVNVDSYLVQFIATITSLTFDILGFPDSAGYDGTFTLRAIMPFNDQVYVKNRDGALEHVSRSTQGSGATADASRPAISGDAMRVVYDSEANTQSITADFNGVADVFLFDRNTQISYMLSSNPVLGQIGDGRSHRAAISGDGSTVAFITAATNLFPPGAPTDANGAGDDILIYDVASGLFVDRVTGPPPPQGGPGPQPNSAIEDVSLSWDGRVVAFTSAASNLDPPVGGPLTSFEVFRLDRDTRELTRLSVAPDGTGANGISLQASVNGDGRYVAFTTRATNLFEDTDSNADAPDIVVYDHATGELERVSLTTAGAQVDGPSGAGEPSISRDGQRVAFAGFGTNLLDGATGALGQAYLYDRVTNSLDVYSKGQSDSLQSSFLGGMEVDLSGDGYTVGWDSNATNLAFDDANGDIDDVFVRGVILSEADDLNGNGVGGDRVLRVFDADEESPGFRSNAQVQFEKASVAAGRVAVLSKESALPFSPSTTLTLQASDVNGVADENADGLGDTISFPPNTLVAGNVSGGPGQNGRARYQVEWSLPGIDFERVLDASVRLRTSPVGGASRDIEFFNVRSPIDGVITPSDYQSLAQALSHPLVPPTFNGFQFIDVSFEVRRNIQIGNPGLGIQARSADEGFGGYTTGLRSDATNVPLVERPQLTIELAGVAVGANGDGDLDDDVLLLYDGTTDTLTPLGISARDVAISDQVLCAVVAEADEDEDLNFDEDEDDLFLAVADLSVSPPVASITSIQAENVVAAGARCFFEESGTGFIGGFDVPTGQTIDIVAAQDQDGNPISPPERLVVEELVAEAGWVAFRVCEDAQGRELNRDGDLSDCVMHLVDTNDTTGPCEAENTLRAAEKCTFDGCDPFFEPYRLRVVPAPTGEPVVTLSFVTFEPTQGGEMPGEGCLTTSPDPSCDLTTDGDDLDFVVQVVNPEREQVQTIEVSPETPVPPFPMTSFNKDLIMVQLPCLALALPGVDCEQVENVTVVVADADADGTFDASITGGDNCSEFNPDQADGDGDGLGAQCDPDTDPVTMQETTTPEQELPGTIACELTGDMVIDESDVDIIFGDRGQVAQPSDPRDPDGDGLITVLDARYCVTQCTNPNCEPSTPLGLSCGFLGIESLLALIPWWMRRRRTR